MQNYGMKYYVILEGNGRWRVKLNLFNMSEKNFSVRITSTCSHNFLDHKTSRSRSSV